ncbi:hypothetical protein [Siccibacter turicensis]|uniref:hypothetical protein n=2 Tax=Siccibacter TaxID=1649298 RepID=UPI001021E6D5|nr:hypothetical protein [Siccibacter turicensis]
MHTQKVKTAAPESSRKMVENTPKVLKERAQALIDAHRCLAKGMTVTIADISRHGDVQVEIRKLGQLDWRAWSFEPDFLADLERQLIAAEQK